MTKFYWFIFVLMVYGLVDHAWKHDAWRTAGFVAIIFMMLSLRETLTNAD